MWAAAFVFNRNDIGKNKNKTYEELFTKRRRGGVNWPTFHREKLRLNPFEILKKASENIFFSKLGKD